MTTPDKLSGYHGILAESLERALFKAADNSRLKELRALLDDGADINTRDNQWKITALGAAASQGKTQVVKLLIERGANLDLPSDLDMTPLMNACSFGKAKGSEAALLLIEAGAHVAHVRASDGMTALKFAAKSCTSEVIQALIDRGADVDGPPGTDQTALMLAARANHLAALEVLARNGADPTKKCMLPWAGGCTALGLAQMEKRRDAAKFLEALAACKKLN